jgi:hypothetical protein
MSDETLETSNGTENTDAVSQQAPAETLLSGGDEASGETVEAEGQKPTEPEGDKTDEEGAEGDKTEDEEPKGAPEAYEEFTAPEGVELDEEVLGEFKGLAKEMDLPQDKAQQVIDLGSKMMIKFAEKQQSIVAEARETWANEAKADKELGGEKFDENLAVAKGALKAFGTPELTQLLNESGLGNHPEVLRMFYRAGKAISEDSVLLGTSGNNAPDPAKRMYPNSNMN